jgi:hypothetical protein
MADLLKNSSLYHMLILNLLSSFVQRPWSVRLKAATLGLLSWVYERGTSLESQWSGDLQFIAMYRSSLENVLSA